MKKVDASLRCTFIPVCSVLVVFLLGMMTSVLPALAAINEQIDFYGTLQNESGVNLAGSYDMVFRFYDASSGGTLLGTDTHTAGNGNPVTVVNGKFGVVLGSGTGNSLAGIDFDRATIYVGLTIGSDSEMVPRERLTAAPYAFNADKVDGYHATELLRYNATGSMTTSTADTLLTLRQNGIGKIFSLYGGGSEVFTVLATGQVGIGTTTPNRDFVVDGSAQLTGALYDSFGTAGSLGMILQTTGISTRWVATSTLGIGGGSSSITGVGPAGSIQTGPTLTLATSTSAFNGLTAGLLITGAGNTITYTPTLTGTLGNAGLANSSIAFATGSTGTDISWSASPVALGDTATLNIPSASAANRGLLTSADWTTFTNKISSTSLDTMAELDNLITDVTGVTGTGSFVLSASPSFSGITLFDIATIASSTIGTLNLSSALTVQNGGTGATSASSARTNLGATTVGANIFTLTNPSSPSLVRINADNTVTAVATSTLGIALGDTTGDLSFSRLSNYGGVNTVLYTSATGVLGTSTSFTFDGTRLLTNTLGVTGTSSFSGAMVASGISLVGAFGDTTNNAGTQGMVLLSTGTSTLWVATSSLGIGGGSGGSLFTDGGATTYLTAVSDNLGIGTTSANAKLTVAGDINLDGNYGLSLNGVRYFSGTTDTDNIQIGRNAGLSFNSLNTSNVAIGFEAGKFASTTNADFNVMLGYQAGLNNAGASNVILGYGAGTYNTDYGNIILGAFAGANNSSDSNIIIGNYAGQNNSDFSNIFIGESAGENNTNNSNYFIGYYAGRNNTGTVNSMFGYNVGVYNTGDENVLLGGLAGYSNQGNDNNILGFASGYDNRGSHNNLLGEYTGYSNTGSYNNIIGHLAGYNNNGAYNDIIGYQAGANLQATNTVAIGANALSGGDVLTNGAGNFQALNNVALGYRAGYTAQTGANNNTLIGYQAADNITTGANNIVMGYDLDLRSPTQSNTMTIGNLLYATGLTATGTATSTGRFGLGTTTPSAQLTTVGTVRFATFGAGTLQTDASGNLSVSSDERLKDIQGDFTKGLDVLTAIDPIQYKWKVSTGYDPSGVYTGFSAQNVQMVLPEAVGKSSDGYLSLSDRPILATVVNAIKEIYAWMHTTDSRVTTLEAQLQSMQNEIDSLKAGEVPTDDQPAAQQPPSPVIGDVSTDATSTESTETVPFSDDTATAETETTPTPDVMTNDDTPAVPLAEAVTPRT